MVLDHVVGGRDLPHVLEESGQRLDEQLGEDLGIVRVAAFGLKLDGRREQGSLQVVAPHAERAQVVLIDGTAFVNRLLGGRLRRRLGGCLRWRCGGCLGGRLGRGGWCVRGVVAAAGEGEQRHKAHKQKEGGAQGTAH